MLIVSPAALLVRVSVVMSAGACHLFWRNNTPFERLATNVLKLYRRVADVKMIFQHMIQIHQDTRAF